MDFKDIDEGHPEGEEPLHFYYNREERIANAPKVVQDYYKGKLLKKTGFFRVLVSTRGNRIMLITMLFCFAIVIFFGFFGKKANEANVAGVPVSLSAFSFEDTVYVSVRMQEPHKKGSAQKIPASPVAVQVKTLDADKQILGSSAINGRYSGHELYLRTTFRDYDILSVQADVSFAGKKETLSAKVEHH